MVVRHTKTPSTSYTLGSQHWCHIQTLRPGPRRTRAEEPQNRKLDAWFCFLKTKKSIQHAYRTLYSVVETNAMAR